ncbi:MAG TPA: phage tail spike protein, partial [Lentisphaeria bacterium]|nr:phage tail spike protein [Lentisphaeria bacterium]
MIWIYEQGHEDFSTNGLGSLLPARCEIKEEQNGAYELELDHPIDKDGLFGLLKTGRVIKAPVPAQTTPIIRMPSTTSYEVWETSAKAKVYTKKSTTLGSTISVTVPGIDLKSKKYDVVAVRGLTENEPKTVTKWQSNGNRVLEKVEAGIEVSVLEKDGAWYKVTTPNGNTGWMQAASLTLVATIAARPPETIQERKIRDQLFRIYRAEKDTEAGEVKVWARHISYDLLGNVLLDCNVNDKTVTQAIAQIDAACTQADHGFTVYTDSTATVTADWSRKGYLEALLDPDEGLLSLANLRLVRDNYDLFLLERSEVSRQSVSYGTNLMGVTLDINEDSIVNRIVPVGKTKDGEPLYIDDEYVDSPRNDAATIIRAKVIEYSDVAEKEAKDNEPAVTLAQAKAALTAKANAEFDLGIDLPDITVDIDFLQLGDTVEYAAYRDLDRLYLGDLI